MNAVTAIEPSLIAALAKALPELESAKKNKANPAFKSKYADIGAVIEAIQPVVQHGLWYRQFSHERTDGACVETFYIHVSGQELSAGIVYLPASKKDAQGFGSAETYARRYGLQLAFGLATEDDDGNAAVKSTQAKSAPAPAQRADAPAGPVTDEQWAKIVGLCQATSIKGAEVKAHVKAENLKVLTPAQFKAAVDYLEGKLAELAKAETNGKVLEDEIPY